MPLTQEQISKMDELVQPKASKLSPEQISSMDKITGLNETSKDLKQPSLKDYVDQSITKPVKTFLGSTLKASAKGAMLADFYADKISNLIGVPETKNSIFELMKNNWEYYGNKLINEGLSEGFVKSLYSALGTAAWDVPEIMATGGLGIHGAIRGYAEGGAKGAAAGAVEGTVMGKILKGLQLFPNVLKHAALFGLGAATAPGNTSEKMAGGITFSALGIGKSPSWKEWRAQQMQNQAGKLMGAANEIFLAAMGPYKADIADIEIRKGRDLKEFSEIAVSKGLPLEKTPGPKGDTLDTRKARSILKEDLREASEYMGEQLKRYDQPIHDLVKIGESVKSRLKKSVKNADELKGMMEDVDSLIAAEVERYGNFIVNPETLNFIKQGMWERGYNGLRPTAHKTARRIGHEMRVDIEEKIPDVKIRDLNRYMGDLLTLETLLERAQGRKIEGGKLGKYFSRMVGAVAGSKIPVIGPLAGYYLGGKIHNLAVDPARISRRAAALYQKALRYSGKVSPEGVRERFQKVAEEIERETPSPAETEGVSAPAEPKQIEFQKKTENLGEIQNYTFERDYLRLASKANDLAATLPSLRKRGMANEAAQTEREVLRLLKLSDDLYQGYLDKQRIRSSSELAGEVLYKGGPEGGGMPARMTPAEQRQIDKMNIQDMSVLTLQKDLTVKDIFGNPKTYKKGHTIYVYKDSETGKAIVKNGTFGILQGGQMERVNQAGSKSGAFSLDLSQVEEVAKGKRYSWEVRLDEISKEKYGKPYQELSEIRQGKVLDIIDREPSEQPTLNETKYSQYQIPGGENYREVVIKAPEQKANRDESILTYTLNGKEYTEDFSTTEKAYKRIEELKTNSTFEATSIEAKYPQSKNADQLNFKSSHWDEPNVLAHVRMNDRTTPDGKKVLFLEELQSDWATEGRKYGFKGDKPVIEKLPPGHRIRKATAEEARTSDPGMEITAGEWVLVDRNNKVTWPTGGDTKEEAFQSALQIIREDPVLADLAIEQSGQINRQVPSHPLLKNWQELALKRALKEAVDGRYDYLSWTTGEQQAERYDLSKRVYSIDWESIGSIKEPKFNIKVRTSPYTVAIEKYNITPKEMNEIIGKDATEKIVAKASIVEGPGDAYGRWDDGSLRDKDLKIGGEWAKNLYDRQVPNMLKDLTKGEVGTIELGKFANNEGVYYKNLKKPVTHTQSALKITPEIRRLVLDQPESGKVDVNTVTGMAAGVAAGSVASRLSKGQGEDEKSDPVSHIQSLVSKGESPEGYNQVFGRKKTLPLDTMTLDEVLQWQSKQRHSPVGRYQILRSTLLEEKKKLGLSGKEKFTPELQDRIFKSLLQKRGYEDWKKGKISDEEFADRLSKEWAALPYKDTGDSYYAKDGLNKAQVSRKEVLDALEKAKRASSKPV